MTDDNPYLVTDVTNAEPPVISDSERSKTGIIIGWVVVFGINLPIPVYFGSGIVSGSGGYLGMALGCVLWCGTGILLCYHGWAKHVRATSWGGLLVALSQFYPMLQIFAGIAAVEMMSVLVTPPMTTNFAILNLVIATALTLLTGAILISIALAAGHTLLLLFHRLVPRSQPLAAVGEWHAG